MQEDDDDDMPSLVYHSRMQYLKARPRGDTTTNTNNNKQQRRRSSTFNILEDNLPSLSQEQLEPCSRDILLPPNELMTRTQSFRQAYWEHHYQPTTRGIKQVFPETNERTERRSKKRKEILAKLIANEKMKREAELRRRAEKIMSQQSKNDNIVESDDESADSDDESESLDVIANSIMRSTMIGGASQRPKEQLPRSHTICVQSAKQAASSAATDTREQSSSDKDFTAGFAFSFINQWSNSDDNDN